MSSKPAKGNYDEDEDGEPTAESPLIPSEEKISNIGNQSFGTYSCSNNRRQGIKEQQQQQHQCQQQPQHPSKDDDEKQKLILNETRTIPNCNYKKSTSSKSKGICYNSSNCKNRNSSITKETSIGTTTTTTVAAIKPLTERINVTTTIGPTKSDNEDSLAKIITNNKNESFVIIENVEEEADKDDDEDGNNKKGETSQISDNCEKSRKHVCISNNIKYKNYSKDTRNSITSSDSNSSGNNSRRLGNKCGGRDSDSDSDNNKTNYTVSSIINNNNNHSNNNHNHNNNNNNYNNNRSDISKMKTKIDAVGRVTGEWGKWQLRTVLLIFLCKIPSSWFMACIIFTAPAPRHGEFYCKPPETVSATNHTQWIKISHPEKEESDDQEFNIDFCNVYRDALDHVHQYFSFDSNSNNYYYNNNNGNNKNNINNNKNKSSTLSKAEPKPWEEPSRNSTKVVPCTTFEHQAEFHSIITQFDLVCSRDILVAVTQFFHLFGVLTGGLLATHLLKHFSPRNVMLFGMITQIFCGNMTGHVISYELHVFFRCLSAVCCGQMYTAGAMIFMDITGGRYRTIVCTLFEQFWSIGVILLPGVASFFKSWTHLYMAISFPTVILIYLWKWIPDSPRWMIERGRVDEAKEILMQCIETNGTKYGLPSDIDQQLQLQAIECMEAPPPANWWSIWKGPRAFRHMICVHLCWSIYIVVYYGMLLNIRSFSRDHLEINTAIAGATEIIGTFIGLYLILYTTRKWLWSGLFNIIGGLIAYTAWIIPPEIKGNNRVALLMLSAMISKAAISSTLAILTTSTTELVADEKKKICAFSTIVWARIWLLTAPFVGATLIFGQFVPQTAFASLSIFGGVLTALISSPRTIPKQKTTNSSNNLPPEIIPGIWTTKTHNNDEKIRM